MGGFQSTWYAIRDTVDGSLLPRRLPSTGHRLRVLDVCATGMDVDVSFAFQAGELSGFWQGCMYQMPCNGNLKAEFL